MIPPGVAIGGNDPYPNHTVFHLLPPPLQFTRLNLVCACVCSVTQLCLTLCDLMDCSPPGYSVYGISQARIFERAGTSHSRAFCRLRDQTASLASPTLAGGFFTTAPPGKPEPYGIVIQKKKKVQKQFHEMQPNTFILRSSCMGKGYIILSQHVVRGVGCNLKVRHFSFLVPVGENTFFTTLYFSLKPQVPAISTMYTYSPKTQ